MASQYYHLLMLQYKEPSLFGTTADPIVYECGPGFRRIKRIKPEIQDDQYTEEYLEDLREEKAKERAERQGDEYEDNNFDTICSAKKKPYKKSTCADVSYDDAVHVLPLVLPVHSIVIQDYTKPDNALGYKIPSKEPTSEEKKKAFNHCKQSRKCCRKRARDTKQYESTFVM